MPSIKIFEPLLREAPSNFAELEVSCGKFIDLWLAEGGEPIDDEVIGFYSLWSQSLDAKGKDEDAFYLWAYPFFLDRLAELRTSIADA